MMDISRLKKLATTISTLAKLNLKRLCIIWDIVNLVISKMILLVLVKKSPNKWRYLSKK